MACESIEYLLNSFKSIQTIPIGMRLNFFFIIFAVKLIKLKKKGFSGYVTTDLANITGKPKRLFINASTKSVKLVTQEVFRPMNKQML
jgi:hypothetical protein